MKKIKMKWLFLLLLTLKSSLIIAYDSSPDDVFKKKLIVLSLGSQCETTSKISHFGHRDASFVFDWILSVDIHSIIEVLNNDFAHFFDENYFAIHPYMSWWLINTKYGFEYRHDWNEAHNFWEEFNSYKVTYTNIKARYDRRIERFKSLGQFKGKVFFLRSAFDSNTCPRAKKMYNPNLFYITYQDGIALRDALKRQFPLLDLTLIIINYKDEIKEKITFPYPDILEVKFTKNSKDKNYEELLQQIFSHTNESAEQCI